MIKENSNTNFFNLLDSSELIFINFDALTYRNEKEKCKKLSLKSQKILGKYMKIEMLKELSKAMENIERMESNIAAGIITGMVSMSKISELGFTSKEIKPILEKYNNEIKQKEQYSENQSTFLLSK